MKSEQGPGGTHADTLQTPHQDSAEVRIKNGAHGNSQVSPRVRWKYQDNAAEFHRTHGYARYVMDLCATMEAERHDILVVDNAEKAPVGNYPLK